MPRLMTGVVWAVAVAMAMVARGSAQPVSPSSPSASSIVVEGTITEADRLTWLERAFDVPPGTARIDFDTSDTHRDQGTAIEWGLYDPERFRGASRTSKSRFFIARDTATPSYHPGRIQPGTWRMLLGIPSIRRGVTSTYRVHIRFTPDGSPQPTPFGVPPEVANSGPRWYRGDMHTHTMHSDGFDCVDRRGGTGPCAAHQVAEAAAHRGLDFLAIADHNTTSHHAGMVDVQASHPRLLLLRAQEVTTFYGHANVYGTSESVDFRIGHAGMTARDVFAQAKALGALVSINHPGRETGEECTGCGWNAPGTDYALVDAIEVVNGRTVSGPTAGEPFWHARLNDGHRIVGIAGSDDHGASTSVNGAVGTPTTVVYADALTEEALLAGIRAGHVYIQTRGPEGPDVRLTVPASGAMMGDVVRLAAGERSIRVRLDVTGGRGQWLDIIRNGIVMAGAVTSPLESNKATLDVPVPVGAGDWVRVNLRDEAGITVMTNPVYVR